MEKNIAFGINAGKNFGNTDSDWFKTQIQLIMNLYSELQHTLIESNILLAKLQDRETQVEVRTVSHDYLLGNLAGELNRYKTRADARLVKLENEVQMLKK